MKSHFRKTSKIRRVKNILKKITIFSLLISIVLSPVIATDTISVNMLPSCTLHSDDQYVYKTMTFEDHCPLCGADNCLQINPKGVPEGEITCSACDADYCGWDGWDKGVVGGSACLRDQLKIVEESNIANNNSDSNNSSNNDSANDTIVNEVLTSVHSEDEKNIKQAEKENKTDESRPENNSNPHSPLKTGVKSIDNEFEDMDKEFDKMDNEFNDLDKFLANIFKF